MGGVDNGGALGDEKSGGAHGYFWLGQVIEASSTMSKKAKRKKARQSEIQVWGLKHFVFGR